MTTKDILSKAIAFLKTAQTTPILHPATVYEVLHALKRARIVATPSTIASFCSRVGVPANTTIEITLLLNPAPIPSEPVDVSFVVALNPQNEQVAIRFDAMLKTAYAKAVADALLAGKLEVKEQMQIKWLEPMPFKGQLAQR